jgi:hypothetical protein
MGCPTELPLCLVRGDNFQQQVSFSNTGWEDVVANPDLYEGRMVFRERQDDTVPDLLSLTAPIQIEADPTYPDPSMFMIFNADVQETQNLPDWTQVAFVELRKVDGSAVQRLYNADVTLED